jgi:hypothetical protein
MLALGVMYMYDTCMLVLGYVYMLYVCVYAMYMCPCARMSMCEDSMIFSDLPYWCYSLLCFFLSFFP